MRFAALTLLLGICGGTWTASADESAAKLAIKPVKVSAELDPFKPGAALALRVLVPYPPEIQGVLSWTIDSKLHRGTITALAVSPDAKLIATGGSDGVVRIWDPASGKLLHALFGHPTYVRGLSWSPCGSTLASVGSWETTARLWDPHAGKPLRVLKGFKSYVYQAVWAPDGSRLALGCYGSGWISMWDPATSELRTVAELGQPIYRMRWSPDTKYLAVTAATLPVSVLETEFGKSKFTLGENSDANIAIDWSPDSKKLIAGSSAKCTIWDLSKENPNDEKAVRKLAVAGADVAWSPDGKSVLTAPGTAVVQQWDPATGKAIASHGFGATELVWQADGQVFATYGGRVTGRKLSDKTPSVDFEVGAASTPLWTLHRPIVSGVGTNTLTVWEATSGRFMQKLEGHTGPISTVSWNRDGKLLASAAQDRKVRIWDVKSGETIATLEGHKSAVSDVAWSPDGRVLATASYDNTVRFWDPSGKPLRTCEGHTGPVRVLAWVPGGNQLASAGQDAKVHFWSAQSDKPLRTISVREPVFSLAFTTINRILIVACGTVTDLLPVYNATSCQQLIALRQSRYSGYTGSLAWSPVGGLIISGRSSYIAQVWDVANSKPLRTISITGGVQYAEWPGNGSTQILGCNDRTTHFLEAASGRYRGVILAEKDGLAMISSDGSWKFDSNKPCDLICVVQTSEGQATMSLDEFVKKYRYRNNASRVKLAPR